MCCSLHAGLLRYSVSINDENFRRLAKEVGLDAGALTEVLELLKELDQILYGLRLLKEESPRLRARVCSFGERLSTVLAVQIIKHHGLSCSLLPVTVYCERPLHTSSTLRHTPRCTRAPRRRAARAAHVGGESRRGISS